MDVEGWVASAHPEMVGLRRALHRIPEVGFEEVKTARFVAARLRELGLAVREGVGKTGVVADLSGSAPGPRVLLRADMDALPIPEETGAPHASEHAGRMHACGHDGHMAVLLAAARFFSENRAGFPGSLRFVFQPGEEGFAGARAMIEDGLLEGGVDAALALHLWQPLGLGRVWVRPGPFMAAMDVFDLTVKGRSAHGAAPHAGVDALVAASHIVSAFQSVVAREVNPLHAAVVTVGTVRGGRARNIICEEVVMEGTCRTLDSDLRETLPWRLDRLAGGVAAAFSASHRLEYTHLYPVLENDPRICEVVAEAARGVVGCENVTPGEPQMVSEDFSFVCERVPGAMFYVGAGGEGFPHPHHHPKFDFDEAALAHGARILIGAALRLLSGGLPA